MLVGAESQRARLGAWRSLVAVAGVTLVVQCLSATFVAKDLTTPNASTLIARALVARGEFSVPAWHRLRGPDGDVPAEPLRAFQLPGEPLYLAAGFRLPAVLWRYLHVPVTVLLVSSIAAVGLLMGGSRLALATGLVANLDPFVLVHGPVWDDTFLVAALEWCLFALVLIGIRYRPARGSHTSVRLALFTMVALLAGCAAVTRATSQVLLGGFGAAAVCLPSFRAVRAHGWAMLVGVFLALMVWGARNAAVVGTFYLGSSHNGLTLFESNYPHAREAILRTGTAEGLSRTHMGPQFSAVARAGEVEADEHFTREAWSYILASPVDVARTAALKLFVSATGYNFALPASSPRNLVPTASNVLLLAFGLWGLCTWWRRGLDHPVGWFTIAGIATSVTLAALALGPTGMRYRIGLTGFLYLGVASAMTDVPRSRTRQLEWGRESLAKRALDVLLSGVGLLCSIPAWAVIAAAVKIADGGPVFFAQERVGRGGRVFRVLKFRSMVPDAEARVGALQASEHDPRVTRIGRWLRATAMDELPQLLSIFRGDMSFVGPRALRPGEIELGGDGREEALEDVPGFAARCQVPPGLTGVAQIYAPRDIPRRQKFRYDRVYIRRQSLWLDLRLIALSFWITFRGTWEVRGRKF